METIETSSDLSQQVKVYLDCEYFPQKSQPDQDKFAWLYTVTVANESSRSIQFLRRSWSLFDHSGVQQEFHGSGIDVSGNQPRIGPEEHFEYSSFVLLRRESGLMFGHFDFRTDDGEHFSVPCPSLSLDSPYGTGLPH